MVFIGVSRAVFDYEATAENELSIKQGDLLCILDKGDDDWWTAKKKAASSEDEEPEGLVPCNYLEEAAPVAKAKAIFEYTRQTDEELSFGEDSILDVYDASDDDWTLVGFSGEYGFAPANYIEASIESETGGAAPHEDEAPPPMPARPRPAAKEPEEDYSAAKAASPATGTPAAALANILHAKASGGPAQTAPALPRETAPSRKRVQFTPEESEEEAPSLPRRPPSEQLPPVSAAPAIKRVHIALPEPSPAGVLPSPPHNRAVASFYDEDNAHRAPGGYHMYNVHEMVEIMGKNRRAPITLGINIAKGIIMLSPENSTSSQEWSADKLTHYSIEGKHVFMELVRPSKSIDMHAGAKETAQSIVAALGELAGAARAEGFRDVIVASSGSDRMGRIIYDFNADEDNEVSVVAGEEVIILDDVKNTSWWLVRRAKDGKTGVVPGSYVEPTSARPRDTNGGSKSFVDQNRAEEERLAREASRNGKVGPGLSLPERGSSLSQDGSKRKSSSKGKSDKKQFPDKRKIRMWTDRSGGFKVEAEFVGFKDGKIHLHKVNGVKIAVPVTKMSPADIEHVERATGLSLDEDKSLADLKRQRSRKEQSGATIVKKPEYDWFDFFLTCGINPQICERYAQAFRRDEMGEESMSDVSSELLRKLGFKEGDILRVMKFLDNKYNRNRDVTPTGTGGLFSGPGGALKQNTKKGRPVPENPAKDAVDERAFETKSSEPKPAEAAKPPAQSLVDGFDDDAWEPRVSKKPAATVTAVSPPLAAAQTTSSVASELAGLSLTSPALQPTPAAPQAAEPDLPQIEPAKPGATPSLFEQLANSSVAQAPQQSSTGLNVPRQRPQAPTQTNSANAMIQPPPTRAASAPQSGPFPPPGQQQNMHMQPLQAQVTGFQGPAMPNQVTPMGQSMYELNAQRQMQQRLMSQPTGMYGYGGMQPQQTGMGFQQPNPQQALVNGQQQNSPFADQPHYQPLMPMYTGMPNMNMGMYQQPQPTGINAFLPPALIPQSTGIRPQHTGFQPQQTGFQPQQTGFQQQHTGFQPQQTGFTNGSYQQAPPPVPPMPPMPQEIPAPLVPQKTGPAPPVRFGVGPAKKLAPQPTGKRANLSAATPQNPFGF